MVEVGCLFSLCPRSILIVFAGVQRYSATSTWIEDQRPLHDADIGKIERRGRYRSWKNQVGSYMQRRLVNSHAEHSSCGNRRNL